MNVIKRYLNKIVGDVLFCFYEVIHNLFVYLVVDCLVVVVWVVLVISFIERCVYCQYCVIDIFQVEKIYQSNYC